VRPVSPRYYFHLAGGDAAKGFKLDLAVSAPTRAVAEAVARAKGRAILEDVLEGDLSTLQVTPALPAPLPETAELEGGQTS